MRWLFLLIPALALAASPEFRLERVPVPGGAELLTVFATVPSRPEPVPLVSVLRDTLGDKEASNDRLRYIWTLTSVSPSLLQRAAGAVPFFYMRAKVGKTADKTPKPVIDLGNTSGIVWNSLAQQIMQVAAIDSNGALIRASTRRYRTNISDRRRFHLAGGLAVFAQLEEMPEVRAALSEDELLEIQARMTLAGQTLGGLVTADKLPDAYFKNRTQTREQRGHNWELLRQRAEANGLYFEPLGMGDSPTHALLWVARDEVEQEREFDSKFLGISSPYRDDRVRNWSGVTVTRTFDPAGRLTDPGTPGAVERELVPLALYGLDYPKVPLLLIDFRNTLAPKRREMLARAASDAVIGMIGYSRWGNWPYMAGSFLWNFTRTRQGAATNGQARLAAYSSVRRILALDSSIPEELRVDLQRRLEILGVNPLEESVFEEFRIADRQYIALRKYAEDPNGLRARLSRDRAGELTAYTHSPMERAGLTAVRVLTFGIFKHKERDEGDALLAALDANRRSEREMRFLKELSDSPEVAWDMDEVRRAVNTLTSIRIPARSAKDVESLLQQFHAAGD